MLVDRRAEAAAVNAIASGAIGRSATGPPSRYPHRLRSIQPRSAVALRCSGDRRPHRDPAALHLEVGKRFCGLPTLDDEGLGDTPDGLWTACERITEVCEELTPSCSLRKAKSLGVVPD
jgi:hypothetical protein